VTESTTERAFGLLTGSAVTLPHNVANARDRQLPQSTCNQELRWNVKKTRFLLAFILAAAIAAFAQEENIPDNRELVARAKTVNVESDTFYMKRENLESSLLGRAEFKAWNLRITGRRDLADLLIKVKRVPFTNHFTYTVTDRQTDTIVIAGKIDSLAGTVYGLIADEIVHKMKVLRGDPLAGKPIPSE
jgi:hypothetical protein